MTLKLRRGVSSLIPTLASGEPGWTTDTNQLFVGDGTTNHLINGGTGTVTSVALAAPGIFTVSGSPITSSGTLALSLQTQTANQVWAGPTSGAAAAPTFRALVAADLPVPVMAAVNLFNSRNNV